MTLNVLPFVFSRSGDDDVENMNPEDINNSIKQMSANIQSLSKMDIPDYDSLNKEKEATSQDSGIQGSTYVSPSPSIFKFFTFKFTLYFRPSSILMWPAQYLTWTMITSMKVRFSSFLWCRAFF
jgi:hypothetical protein